MSSKNKEVTLEEILEKKQNPKEKPKPKPKEKPKAKPNPKPADEQNEETGKAETKEKSKPTPKQVSTKRLALTLLAKIAAVAIGVWLVLFFVVGITIHYGNNMHPAIRDGELVISLKLQRPYLNSAVLYKHDKKTCVGRVVGLPGNTIEITEQGELRVNGVTAAEDIYYPTFRSENSDIKYPYTVEEGKVFILNDYREDTNDSRTFGTIDISDVEGPVIFSFRRRGF